MKLKCTMCGSNNLELVDNKKFSELILGNNKVQNGAMLTIYTCKECGHLEFFSGKPIQNKAINELEEMLLNLKQDLKTKKNNNVSVEEINRLEKTISEFENNIKDLKKDIL